MSHLQEDFPYERAYLLSGARGYDRKPILALCLLHATRPQTELGYRGSESPTSRKPSNRAGDVL